MFNYFQPLPCMGRQYGITEPKLLFMDEIQANVIKVINSFDYDR